MLSIRKCFCFKGSLLYNQLNICMLRNYPVYKNDKVSIFSFYVVLQCRNRGTEYVFFQIKVSFISLFDNFKQCAMKHKGGKQQKWLEDLNKPCPEGNKYRRCIGTRTDVCVFGTCKFLIFFAWSWVFLHALDFGIEVGPKGQ